MLLTILNNGVEGQVHDKSNTLVIYAIEAADISLLSMLKVPHENILLGLVYLRLLKKRWRMN